jgi:hypothetical protein
VIVFGDEEERDRQSFLVKWHWEKWWKWFPNRFCEYSKREKIESLEMVKSAIEFLTHQISEFLEAIVRKYTAGHFHKANALIKVPARWAKSDFKVHFFQVFNFKTIGLIAALLRGNYIFYIFLKGQKNWMNFFGHISEEGFTFDQQLIENSFNLTEHRVFCLTLTKIFNIKSFQRAGKQAYFRRIT